VPNKYGDQDRDQHDDHDAERSRAAAVLTIAVDYNRAICHTGSCSFRRSVPTYTHDRQALKHRRRTAVIMWSFAGLVLCAIAISVAAVKSRRGTGSYYEGEVYGMTARTHRAYLSLSVLFALAFVAALFTSVIPAVPLLGAYALIFIFYLSSFARGFSDEE
jgi:hypothetical protein